MHIMTHRERVLAAVNHQEPDRVPLDYGSTMASTHIKKGYNNLKRYLGLDHETRITWPRLGGVIPDESILRRFDIDTRPLYLGTFQGGYSKQIDEFTYVDFWHTTWMKSKEGHFINIEGPFQNDEPSISQLENFSWPDHANSGLYEGLRERALEWKENTDCAIVLNLPLGPVHQCQFLRGFTEWLVDLYERPDYAVRMADLYAEFWVKVAENALDLVGDLVDIVAWCDDIAMQQALLVSPAVYRNHIKPCHKKLNDALHSMTDAKVWYHSCGSVYPLVEDLIEIGVDILNPIQVSANNMEPGRLKTEFGSKISFWGGIDTQQVLPFGTPEDVREAVRQAIDCLAKGGGYVLASVHNIQNDVPPKNIVAMLDEARAYGQRY